MQTKHYIIENIAEFSDQVEAVKRLKEYLNCIEEKAFPAIEEVFGSTWDDNQIHIKLDDSTGGGGYYHNGSFHIVKIGINNKNTQKKYPENLWGCLFHETLHAFMNPIVKNDNKNRDLNDGKEGEPFTRSFQQTVYFKLKDKEIINEKLCEYFFNMHIKEINNDAKNLFENYVKIFSKNNNFSKFINYLKSNKILFTNKDNFSIDLNKAKEFLLIN